MLFSTFRICAENVTGVITVWQRSRTSPINRTNIPTIPTLQKLCDGFGITLSDFFTENSDRPQLTVGQQEVIELYNRLDHEKKYVLKAYMKGLLMDV